MNIMLVRVLKEGWFISLKETGIEKKLEDKKVDKKLEDTEPMCSSEKEGIHSHSPVSSGYVYISVSCHMLE